MSEEQNLIADSKTELCAIYNSTVDFFNQLPNCITELKKQYILDQAGVNTRFVVLCLGALSTAAVTARFQPSFLKVTRNAVLSYVGAGLFVVPEVFNPYLAFRK